MNTIIHTEAVARKIARKARAEKALSWDEALAVLNAPDGELPELLGAAGALRKKYKGNMVSVQILTNARSGDCSQDCGYCAQSRAARADINTYRLLAYEKIKRDGRLVRERNLARHCIGLSGIRFSDQDIEEFAAYVEKLKTEAPSPICCSIGFLTPRQAQRLKAAGVNRINHNLNTGKNFYRHICTTHTYEERAANIKMLQDLGFEICCGGIVGLGEQQEDVADMLLAIRDINPQSVPINFLLPLPGTPLALADVSRLSPEYCLKVLCLARLLIPMSDIRCAAGREVYLRGKEKELFRVADSIFAAGYLTAGGQSIDETIALITAAGFAYQLEFS
jgi:biotin synthase